MESNAYLLVMLIAYFAPTWIAARGRRRSIFVLNLFFGWTVVGWVVALFMAIRSQENGKAGA
jgi:hypothetical protein